SELTQGPVVLEGVLGAQDEGDAVTRRVAEALLQLGDRAVRGVLLVLHLRLRDAAYVGGSVREHAAVAHPVLVDGLVVARAVAVRLVVARVVVEPRVAARRAALADALGAAEEPDARLEAEVLRRERAHGADVL